jgi:hypothetical protein
MDAHEFVIWRQRVGITQDIAASKIGVSRNTIQNWETGGSAIPAAVATSCQIWERRLKQENPAFGPVTLIYSDGPMFVNAYGPRPHRVAMMKQEPYPTNAAALSRVVELWGGEEFHNPFVIEASGEALWNVVELARVADGSDSGVRTVAQWKESALRAAGAHIISSANVFVRGGPATLSPSEATDRTKQIRELGEQITNLADQVSGGLVRYAQFEEILLALRALGKQPMAPLVSDVAQAFASDISGQYR